MSRAMIASSLAVAVIASGCTTTTTSLKTYQTKIESTPERAYVWSTDSEEGEAKGLTPLTLEGEYEVAHTEVNWWMAGAGLALSSILVLGGVGLATSTTTTTTSVNGTTTDVDESGPSGGAIGGGALMVGLGGLGAWWAIDAMASDDEIEIDGTVIGDREDLSEEDYLAALPKQTYQVMSPGFVEMEHTFRPGSSTTISLMPAPEGSAPSAVAHRSNDKRSNDQPDAPAEPKSTSSTVVASPQPTAYALVVGIENYRNIPATMGAKADAQRFAKMLEKTFGVPSNHIHLLTDDGATRSDILAKLDWLKSNVPEDGRIYFYFSGHGSPNVESGDSYILPFEGKPETISHSGVEMESVLSTLGDSKAREVLAFVDACFSGRGGRSVLPEGTRPLVPVQKLEAKTKVALFSASGAKEIAGNVPGKEGGLFTHHLIEALSTGSSDIDGDGRISLEEINAFVAPRVARDARSASRNQTPDLDVSKRLGAASDVIVVWGLPIE